MVQDDEGKRLEAQAQKRINQYQMRKSGHDHEWLLLSGRMAVLLTSQSLFATGAALLYNGGSLLGVFFLAFIALVVAFASSVSIAINCRVLSDWHIYIQKLIASDSDNFLDGLYMARRQPDLFHQISVDVFHNFIPVLAGLAWIVVMDTILFANGYVPYIITNNYNSIHEITKGFVIGIEMFCVGGWGVLLVLIYIKGSLIKD